MLFVVHTLIVIIFLAIYSLVAVLSCEVSSTVMFLSSAVAAMEIHTSMPPSDSNASKLAEVKLMLPGTIEGVRDEVN